MRPSGHHTVILYIIKITSLHFTPCVHIRKIDNVKPMLHCQVFIGHFSGIEAQH